MWNSLKCFEYFAWFDCWLTLRPSFIFDLKFLPSRFITCRMLTRDTQSHDNSINSHNPIAKPNEFGLIGIESGFEILIWKCHVWFECCAFPGKRFNFYPRLVFQIACHRVCASQQVIRLNWLFFFQNWYWHISRAMSCHRRRNVDPQWAKRKNKNKNKKNKQVNVTVCEENEFTWTRPSQRR